MYRQIFVAMVGLTFAGCAQTSPARLVSQNDSGLPPVVRNRVPDTEKAIDRENTPVVTNAGAVPVSSLAAPDQAVATIKTSEKAAIQTSGAPGEVDPAPSRLPATVSDPLLGSEPDVVPLPALAPPLGATPGTLPPEPSK